MPEAPNIKLREPPAPPPSNVPAREAYAELEVTTNFSFLRGAAHPDEMVFRAAELGYRAVAITDRNTLAGVVRAHDAAKQIRQQGGVPPKLIIGTRLVFEEGLELLVWPGDRAAYARLCRLLTVGKRRAQKGECRLFLEDFLEQSEGMWAALCITGILPVLERHGPEARDTVRLQDALRSRFSIAVSALYDGDNESHLRRMAEFGRSLRVPLLATNHVHYHDPSRRELQDVLTCVRHGCTIEQAGQRLFANAERYLKTPVQMRRIFMDYPGAIGRGLEIAEACNFSLDELRYEYPQELAPEGMRASEYLRRLAYQGAVERLGDEADCVRNLLDRELALIEQLHFEAYFLTVHDLVRFARSRGILCQGRGSAANSAVCYCLGITSVDPTKIDLLFERFISAARNEPPDIDVDFEHERREEVIQYIYEKYGRERAGMTAEVITYRGRSAVRDVGKAMGLSLDLVDQMAKKLDWWHRGSLSEQMLAQLGLDPANATIRRVIDLTTQLLGFPRHLSQHVGGMVMTRGPLCEMVPIENASMPGRTVIEWDKDDIDSLGILKVDALALGMLTCISKAFGMIEASDEATKRRSDEGEDKEAFERSVFYGGQCEGADASGSDCVAEGQRAGEDDLRRDSSDAGGRKVRVDESDAASGSLNSIEYRGGTRAAEPGGLSQISANGSRFTGRTDDASGDFVGARVDATPSSSGAVDGGRGSNSSGIDPQSRAETVERVKEQISDAGEKPVMTGPSSLRRFVASSLSPHRLQLHTIPQDDPLVYDMICDADTIGVFQIESRAQMTMLPRLKPRNFYDIVIEVAIVRPGPIQGDMVHPYLRRRNGEEAVSYPSPELRGVLEKTLGVPLFQEQAMRIAMVGAGFTADEADQLRRAMAAWKKSGAIEKFHEKIVTGMLANGYTREFAEQCFSQIKGFGEYGFPESHAASFALLVYVSAWIKRYYPAAFAAALLNSQPMGFYAPAQIVRDAKEHGVEVRGVDVNGSGWNCSLEEATKGKDERQNVQRSTSNVQRPKEEWGKDGPALRLGFRLIKGLREEFARRIERVRGRMGGFTTIAQFHAATGLPVHAIRRLADADAFNSLGLVRRHAIWQCLELKDEIAPLFDPSSSSLTSCLRASVPSCLPEMPLGQEVMTDYATTTLSLKCHPVSLIRAHLEKLGIVTARQIEDAPQGQWVRVAGLVLIRQRPGTASGIVFETLEDETGIVNIIVKPDIYDRYQPAARHAGLLQCEGRVQRQGQVIHIMARRLCDLSHLLAGYQLTSRDFH